LHHRNVFCFIAILAAFLYCTCAVSAQVVCGFAHYLIKAYTSRVEAPTNVERMVHYEHLYVHHQIFFAINVFKHNYALQMWNMSTSSLTLVSCILPYSPVMLLQSLTEVSAAFICDMCLSILPLAAVMLSCLAFCIDMLGV